MGARLGYGLAVSVPVVLLALLVGCGKCREGYEEVDGLCLPPGAGRDAGFPDAAQRVDAALEELDGGGRDAEAPDFGTYDGGTPEDPTVVLGAPGRILLLGALVLPMDGAEHRPGELYIENGAVACVGGLGSCQGLATGATVVDTKGVILPGLVDAHNHVAFNYLPEWVSGRLWDDHDQWQGSQAYDEFTRIHSQAKSDADNLCAMVQWGELRSLVNGTTSLYGAQQARACFRWLVRNVELSSGYNGFASDRVRSNALGVDSLTADAAASLVAAMDAGEVAAYLIHVGEGISARARDELFELDAYGLLRSETVIIHGTAFEKPDFELMAQRGAKLVWSPSSNLVLYGFTTDVSEALASGLSVSLAPDWTVSGEDDVLHELRLARFFLATSGDGLLQDRDLVRMATRIPAEQLGAGAQIGTLSPGAFADVLVLTVDPARSYAAVVDARPQDVRLVMIGGVPSYGDPALLLPMTETPACQPVEACGREKLICFQDPPSGPVTVESIRARIAGFYPTGPLPLFDCR